MSKILMAALAARPSFADFNIAAGEKLTIGRIRIELLAGLTVALALVPEAVAFAFVAGVHPLVGLYAAFLVGLITALIGGRP
ncbi:MAG: SulP family inorganic anion transporter, partial [Pseudomonadota bacterium]